MKENVLVELSKKFSVDIINVCVELKADRKIYALIDQLMRSGTSIGANIHEGNYASSKADFINKFQIAQKECYETDYWLEIFKDVKILTDEQYANLHSQCSKIRKILTASIKTAKETLNKA